MQIFMLFNTIADEIMKRTNSSLFDVEQTFKSSTTEYCEYTIKNFEVNGMQVVFGCFHNFPHMLFLRTNEKTIMISSVDSSFKEKKEKIFQKVTKAISRKEVIAV